MENASKALLMAGGILVAMLIIAVLVSGKATINSFQKTKLSEEEKEQIIIFNKQYTKYVGQYVYGTDVRTLINKYENDRLVKVLPEDLNPPTGIGQDTKYYKCTGVGFDNTGKVNTISFEQVTVK